MKNICIDGKPVKKAYIDGKLWHQAKSGYGGLCITSLEDGNEISIVKNGSAPACTFEYSTDGSNWNSYTIGNKITIGKDEKVYFRSGINGNSIISSSVSNYHYFTISKKANVSGNINSILKQDFESVISLQNYAFLYLFKLTEIVDASSLLLPAMTLTNYCYYRMFHSCSSLTQAPELPATALASNCYQQMFYGCIELNQIKVHFNSFYSSGTTYGTTGWMTNTSATGTFICPEGLVIPERGTRTVPEGWTIERF